MPEKEIDFVLYLNVLWRKRKIVIFTLSLVLILWGLKLSLAKFLGIGELYKTVGIIEIGKISQNDFIEPPEETAQKIKNKGYLKEDFEAEVLGKTSLVKVEKISSDFKDAETKMNTLFEKILETHQKKLEKEKKEILETCQIYEKEIKKIEKEIEDLKKQNKETEDLIKKLVKEEKSVSSFLSFRSTLLSRILSQRQLKERYQKNLINEKKTLSFMEPTKIIKKPESFPILGKKEIIKKTILFLVLGIILGVFFAFLKEFWEENKERILRE